MGRRYPKKYRTGQVAYLRQETERFQGKGIVIGHKAVPGGQSRHIYVMFSDLAVGLFHHTQLSREPGRQYIANRITGLSEILKEQYGERLAKEGAWTKLYGNLK